LHKKSKGIIGAEVGKGWVWQDAQPPRMLIVVFTKFYLIFRQISSIVDDKRHCCRKARSKVMEWIFDGIGTEIISLIAGLVFGGGAGAFIGIKIGIKKVDKQTVSRKVGEGSTVSGNGMIVGGDYTKNK
jgi:hypothetical protein